MRVGVQDFFIVIGVAVLAVGAAVALSKKRQ